MLDLGHVANEVTEKLLITAITTAAGYIFARVCKTLPFKKKSLTLL